MDPSSFELCISFRDNETNEPIFFKTDGGRFTTSTRTIKLSVGCVYKITISCKPWRQLQSLNLSGSELLLNTESEGSAMRYVTHWNTDQQIPSRRATRFDLLLAVVQDSGPNQKIWQKPLQAKFYRNNDPHAKYGSKLESLLWKCAEGEKCEVVDEVFQ
uniref:CB1 cannabinoid receptor-interacting protein 1 n=1 Tax=Syphacia muris TaxID=451379 RepID=A0A0N5AET8_9BILA